MAKSKEGFSLLELIAVLAVMSILAMMALPSMLEKLVREQVTEAMQTAQIATVAVGKYWLLNGKMPESNEAAGLPAADKIVSNLISSVTIENGAVHIAFGTQANGSLKGKTLSLRPAVVPDAPMVPVTWLCANAKTPDKMSVQGSNKTNVNTIYLPLRCR